MKPKKLGTAVPLQRWQQIVQSAQNSPPRERTPEEEAELQKLLQQLPGLTIFHIPPKD